MLPGSNPRYIVINKPSFSILLALLLAIIPLQKDGNRAEALLIALYWKDQINGKRD